MSYQFMNGVDSKKISWIDKLPDGRMEVCEEHLNAFFKSMYQRQEVWCNRFAFKKDPPWSDNEIFNTHAFTNVYREMDRASQWMIQNILLDHDLSVKDLLWKMMVYRFYNEPDTFSGHKGKLVVLPNYDDFDPNGMWMETRAVRDSGRNPWHTAYLMNLAFLKKPKDWNEKTLGKFKDYAYVKHVFQKVHDFIPSLLTVLREAKKPTEITKSLEALPAVSGFQSHEFYIDFCYVAKYWKKPVMPFDQDDYTNVGPGASLGLRLVFPSLEPNEQIKGIYTLRDIARDWINEMGLDFKYLHWSRKKQQYVLNRECNITLHQIEMWLCEYQKFWKMQLKAGKQRSKFKPKTSNQNFNLSIQL